MKLSRISAVFSMLLIAPFFIFPYGQASAAQEEKVEIRTELSGRNLDGTAIDPGISAKKYSALPRGERAVPLTGQQRDELLKENTRRLTENTEKLTQSRKYSDEPIPVDDHSIDECQRGIGQIAPSPEGIEITRHIYCVGSTWHATNKRCTSKGCTIIDEAKYDMFILGLGSNEGRSVSFDIRLTNIRDTKGAWQLIMPKLTMLCDPDISTTACGAGGIINYTLGTWQNNPDRHMSINSFDTEGSVGENKLAWYDVTLNMQYGISAGTVMSAGVRCDSATGLRGAEGCIFDRDTPTWAISQEGNTMIFRTQAVGRHISKAFNSPGATIPEKQGKSVPGEYGTQPLSRTRDASQIRQNRRLSVKECEIEWPGYATTGQQCDEFPMASTHQGAGTGDGNFSVMVMPKAENEGAGNYWGWWSSSYRMLEDDPFWVAPYWPAPE